MKTKNTDDVIEMLVEVVCSRANVAPVKSNSIKPPCALARLTCAEEALELHNKFVLTKVKNH